MIILTHIWRNSVSPMSPSAVSPICSLDMSILPFEMGNIVFFRFWVLPNCPKHPLSKFKQYFFCLKSIYLRGGGNSNASDILYSTCYYFLYYTALHFTILHCNVIYHTALNCNLLYNIAPFFCFFTKTIYNASKFYILHCNVIYNSALHCNSLKLTAL